MKNRIVFGVIFLLILLSLCGLYLFNLTKNVEKIFVTAVSVVNAFNNDENNANKLYLGQHLVISGQVSQILSEEPYSLLIDGGNGFVQCEFVGPSKEISVGDLISVEGECTGYLMDVILTNCKIYVENE